MSRARETTFRGYLLARIAVEDRGHRSPCWTWTKFLTPKGYARANLASYAIKNTRHNRISYLHRASYEEFVGPIPDGLVIDHLCRNRACLNPAHLETVTIGENSRRGKHWSGTVHIGPPALPSHCRNGHEFTLANTYSGEDRYYRCRTCRKASLREHALRRKLLKARHRITPAQATAA